MEYNKGVSYKAGFYMLIAFAVGGFFIGAMIAGALGSAISGLPAEAITTIINDPKHYRTSQLMQLITVIFGMLLPTYFAATRLHTQPVRLLGLNQPPHVRQLMLTIAIITCGIMISSSLGLLSYQLPIPSTWKTYFDGLEQTYMKSIGSMLNLNSPGELIVSILILAALPAICEEVFFRGGLQNFLQRGTGKPILALIVVSLIFSVIHLSFYGFLSRFFLGLVLGLLFQTTGKLWLSILAHFINNAMAVIAVYYYKNSGKPMEEIMNDRSGSYWGLLFIPVIIFLIMRLKKLSATQRVSDSI